MSVVYIPNNNQIVQSKISICIRLVFCIASFFVTSHTHHGQSFAFSLLKRLYTLHPRHIPKTDSKNKNTKHIRQITRLICPIL